MTNGSSFPTPRSLLVGIVIVMSALMGTDGAFQCGMRGASKLARRIIGGRTVVNGEFPWIVSGTINVALNFKTTRSPYCSGSLISPRWVITAAHCFIKTKIAKVQVEIGSSNLYQPPAFASGIKKVYIPEEFSPKDPFKGYDIALVALESSFPLNSRVGTICLPPEGSIFLGPVTAVGWGCTSTENHATSRLLQAIDLIMFPNQACSALYQKDPTKALCAGIPTKCGKGVCEGDSGGPIQQYMGGRYVVAGLLSYGTNGCLGVYTSIVEYTTWIHQVLNKHGGL